MCLDEQKFTVTNRDCQNIVTGIGNYCNDSSGSVAVSTALIIGILFSRQAMLTAELPNDSD